MAITDWPAQERPREKLLARGPDALSDAELLAIFLRTGCQGQSAVDLARSTLQRFGSLRELLEANQQQFCSGLGLGTAKYCQLQAVLEMSRRHVAERLHDKPLMNHCHLVKRFLSSRLRHRKQEVFCVLFLDSQHQLITCEDLFTGTLNAAAVYPREVARRALELHAASVILAHNHPSGIAEPSDSDAHLTRSIERALGLLDIRTLDHLIVGDEEVFSFAEHGKMATF